MAKCGDALRRVAPVRLGDAVGLEHRLRSQPARRERHRRRAVRRELVRQRERHPVHRRLGQVVEERDAVVRRVVLVGSVGHLDDQAARRLDEQREREVAGDGVRVHGQAQRAQPDVQRGLPDGLVPLHRGGAPDVVHEDVQARPARARCAPPARAPRRARGGRPATAIPRPPASSTSAAVSSIVSGRFISDRWERVVRPVT